jgi:hypothetical protein
LPIKSYFVNPENGLEHFDHLVRVFVPHGCAPVNPEERQKSLVVLIMINVVAFSFQSETTNRGKLKKIERANQFDQMLPDGPTPK